MKRNQSKAAKTTAVTSTTSSAANGFLPSSIKLLSSCIKTVSSGVRSAAASISADSDDRKDQVLWACFDRLQIGPSSFKNVLLLGYINGFQVFDVEDASNVIELVSRRDDPCTFMQIQPIPMKTKDNEGFRASHPLLLIVTGDEAKGSDPMLRRDGFAEAQLRSSSNVRFYSMRSHNYVHVLRFRSAVYMVRCSPHVIAVGLASQIYCFDALTLENKFSVLSYPVPQPGGQGIHGVNIGYGPMDVGPRWLAYTPNNPLSTNTGRLSPQSLTPGISPSSSPGNGSLVARYAVESSKQLAAGLISLGDMGYKTLSKYCQEILPDGPSSPRSSNAGWKAGISTHSSEMDNVGMVVVKDFVSKVIVSQFKAHSSPISALCFDPSGTLLVTASIHGNNINIFRIMPPFLRNGSDSQSHNWTSSHVHLYKLHRGITSAVIQDICFSNYSQWVAIVSSKGTCHIYVISPFGGESGLVQNFHADGPTLAPMLSIPWWHVSSYNKNRHSFPAPPPAAVTVSVVSRIRTGNSGWLSNVTNAASSAAGTTSMAYGAVSAVFHRSVSSGLERNGLKVNALEHLLVYSPSGHLIQYEMVPSLGAEKNETALKAGSGSMVQMQEDELRVKSEPVQWWDVCRRADWPEREECITGITLLRNNSSGMGIDSSDSEDNDTSSGRKAPAKLQERSHCYLSNAEVQMNYGKVPIWQRSKICFYTMSLVGRGVDSSGGEIAIEAFPDHGVEIRWKDLLPVFNHTQNVQLGWTDSDRGYGHLNVSDNFLGEEKYVQDAVVFTDKSVYPKAVQRSEVGNGSTPIPGPFLDSSQLDMFKSYPPALQTPVEKNVKRSSSFSVSTLPTQGLTESYKIGAKTDNSAMNISPRNNYLVKSPSSFGHKIETAECFIPKEVQSSNSVGSSETSTVSSNRSDFSMNLVDEGSVEETCQDQIEFGHFFQEEYCKASPDESTDMGEVVTDVDSSSSPHAKEKSEEDMENDEIFGGMFDFAEEGAVGFGH